MKAKLNALRRIPQEQIWIYALVSGAFLPFYITIAVILAIFVCVLVHPRARRSLLSPKYTRWAAVFCGYTAVVAVLSQNWFGLLCSAAFFIILSLGHFTRQYIQPATLWNILWLACILSAVCSLLALVDWAVQVHLLGVHPALYRCQLFFFNPNYLATMLVAGVLADLFLVLERRGKKRVLYPLAALQLVGLYFTGSVFAWPALLVGVCVLLLLVRRVRPLVLLLLFVAALALICLLVPLVMQRWNEMDDTIRNRLSIWTAAFEDIKTRFLVGRGFFGYFQLALADSSLYQTTHAHNILIDSLLNYGLLGCVPAVLYFINYYRDVLRRYRHGGQWAYSGFVLAGTAAVLVHSLVDMTMLWVQTGLLFAVLLGALGTGEKEVEYAQQNAVDTKE